MKSKQDEDLARIQRSGMNFAVAAQCFAGVSMLAFSNNLLLLFLNAAGVDRSRILIYLSLPMLADLLFRIPAGYWSDQLGKKRVGVAGMVMNVIGYVVITMAGSFAGASAELLAVVGMVVYSVGAAVMAGGWFALLSPIVPENLRGRFFGRLRFSWQLVGIVFATICALVLSETAPMRVFQFLLAAIAIALAIRIPIYMQIRELEQEPSRGQGLLRSMSAAIHGEGFMSFCSYVFLLSLFTMSCPTLFGLIEKKVMLLGDSHVAWMGNLMMIGSVVGFFLGGRLVDRFGTKPVFLVCHLSFALVVFAFVGRNLVPGAAVWVVSIARALYGLVFAASSIAISTELMALMAAGNKSMSASICNTLGRGGGAIAGLLSAWALKAGPLSESWVLGGMSMSSCDTLLIACAVMTLLLVVTLSLVPSVMSRAQWIPR